MALDHQSKDTQQRTSCPPLLICSDTYLRHLKLWNPVENNYVCGMNLKWFEPEIWTAGVKMP